jgi:hypothetical protein
VGYSNIWLLYIVAACSKIMHFISRILNVLQILCARIVWRQYIELPTKSFNIILFYTKNLRCSTPFSLLVWSIKEVVCFFFFHFFCCIYISPYFFPFIFIIFFSISSLNICLFLNLSYKLFRFAFYKIITVLNKHPDF